MHLSTSVCPRNPGGSLLFSLGTFIVLKGPPLPVARPFRYSSGFLLPAIYSPSCSPANAHVNQLNVVSVMIPYWFSLQHMSAADQL